MAGKGGDWERETCRFLSKWIQGTEKPYLLWRGNGSGAMFTNNESVGERFAGDIYHVREEGKFLTNLFSIECKSGYPKSTLDNHLKYNKSDPIREFWEQCTGDAFKTNKFPMLIFKKKGFKTPWVGIDDRVYSILESYFLESRVVSVKYDGLLSTLHLIERNEFFSIITPEIMKNTLGVTNENSI